MLGGLVIKDVVSVIIPIYKTEEYLDRCVESVVNQTYQNLEIILVEDGSPDNCPQMCDEWAKRDSRIRVIHKQNQGLGMARNTGIENATGVYICFFDSDDYVAPQTIEHAYVLAQEQRADIVVFGFSDIDFAGKTIRQRIPKTEKTVYSGDEVQEAFLPDLISTNPQTGIETNLWMSACMCLYSMQVITTAGWRFVSEREIISEDIYSLLSLYRYVNTVVVMKEALYFVQENPASLSRSYRPKRFERIRHFYERCLLLCRDCGYTQEVEYRCAEPFLSSTIAAMKQEVAYHKRASQAVAPLREIIDDELLQRTLQKKRNDKNNGKKKVLFWAMRHRKYMLCYVLLAAKNRAEGK